MSLSTTRVPSALFGLALSFLLVFPSCLPAQARQPQQYSPEYIRAAQAFLAQRYCESREIAERMLASDPDSVEAHAALGRLHLWAEGDLAQAEHHLHRALKLLEAPSKPLIKEPLEELHRTVLMDLRLTAQELEDYRRALEILEQHDRLYQPNQLYLRGWPLLKLGELELAEAVMLNAREHFDELDPRLPGVLDLLGQVQMQRGLIHEALPFFEEASFLELDLRDYPEPVYLTNLGEAYRDLLRFEEAERTWLQATQWPHPETFASPHDHLATLYAGQGRFDEAFAQLEESKRWRSQLSQRVNALTRARHLTAVGEVMLAFGDSELALEALELALESPFRNSMVSEPAEQTWNRRYLLYAAALALELQRNLERSSWLIGGEKWGLLKQRLALEARLLWARNQARVWAARGLGVQPQLSPYGPGTLNSPWLLPELPRCYGRGVVLAALLASGDASAASKQSEGYRALLTPKDGPQEPTIPESERLALASLLLDHEEVLASLKLDPNAPRRHRLPLKITIEGPKVVAQTVLASPRFERGTDLLLKVSPELGAEFLDADGNLLVALAKQPSVESLSRELHQQLFASTTSWDRETRRLLLYEASPGRLESQRLQRLLQAL